MSKNLELINIDPWLKPAEKNLTERHRRFVNKLSGIEKKHGSISEYSNGYMYYGINHNKANNTFTYREWAPNAKKLFLTGDFNDWNKYSHPLTKINKCDWEIVLDANLYADKFVHGSKVKVIVISDIGEHFRIPAYIKRAVQDDDTKNFSGQVWFSEPFDWFEFENKIERNNLYIYEAHIGMAQEKEGVGTYTEFTENILPRIKKAGYNAVQLMGIHEHPYYGSFGYHVSNFFAPSSRFGTPEELKTLINTAHKMGIAVIMDIVHSHSVKNLNEGLNKFDGSANSYFYKGDKGIHPDWDSLLFDYGNEAVQHFLLSNIKYWIEEFHFDGFRFDGVGSMLYEHHGNETFDSIDKYFNSSVDENAILYLQLANELAHNLNPNFITIAEDVSGMPGLAYPCNDGGIGFDYRLGMGIPDFWIKMLTDIPDENWNIREIWNVLCDRLYYIKTVAYAESHDQAMVGDKTIAFRLMDKEMYDLMQITDRNHIIDRGLALHKLIRFITLALGGQAYLNFMGNEFGHPEWIDFPRLGNNWSYKYAQRKWSLTDNKDLKYHMLANFDRDMISFAKKANLLDGGYGNILKIDEENKCLVFEKSDLIFVFNFNTNKSFEGYEVPVNRLGFYKIVFNSDKPEYAGHNRIDDSMLYESKTEEGSKPFIKMYLTNRTALVFRYDKFM